MAKVKDLNLLLEFGQKNLQSAMVSTIERYKGKLLSLMEGSLKQVAGIAELSELERYQSGVREVIEELKRIKEGKATTYEGVKFEVSTTYEICGPAPHVFCIQNIPMDEKELMGNLLIYNELVKVPYLVDDFDYCQVCGNIYAIASKNSKFCSKLCRGNYQKQNPG